MAEYHKWKPVFVILTVYFLMAVLNILFKMVLDEGRNQLVIISYRLIVGAIFLSPIAYLCERKTSSRLTTPILCHLFFSALMGATLTQCLFLMGIHYTSAAYSTAFINMTPVITFLLALPLRATLTQCLFLMGIHYTSAAYSTAFINMTPVITFLLALPLRQENVIIRSKSGIAKVSGSLICIGGVILLILYKGFSLNHTGISSYHHGHNNSELDNPRNWTLGSFILILSMFCWSGWFLIQARTGQIYSCKYTSTTVMSAFGAVQSTILCFAINSRDASVWIIRGKLEILTILSAGIFGSGFCYVGISWCVEQKGPVFTAAFSPFIQIFVMILDFTLFHEPIYFGSVLGSVLVVCGLYILLWGKSRGTMANISKQPEVAECNGSLASITMVK